TSIRTDYGAGATQVTVANATEISVGDQLLITNFTQGHIVKVTSVNTATGVLGLGAQCGTIALPSGGYLAGALVIRVLRARFYVADLDGIPTLMMDPDADGSAAGEPVADGVEDFQLALGVDADGSGTLLEVGAAAGDDEWAYNVSGDAALAGSIRAVRISLVARATAKVTGTATFTRPAVEDRAAGATTDNYRRRVLSSSVEIRNLGGSP
ncbi:MAG: PilW family protein, partial [Kofleriaceae bacterium]